MWAIFHRCYIASPSINSVTSIVIKDIYYHQFVLISKWPPLANTLHQKMMKQRKHLYNLARSLQTDEAWSNYRKLKNKITNSIRESHNKYQNSLFLQDGGLNHKQFWRYIKSTRKDQSGVSPLNVNGSHIYSAKDKAEALNSQFQSV